MTHTDDTGVEEAHGTPAWVGASELQDLAPGSIYQTRGVVDSALLLVGPWEPLQAILLDKYLH